MGSKKAAKKKLWDKGEPLDAKIERFTVGRDPMLDRVLVAYDALATAAHGTMLTELGILAAKDLKKLLAELKRIAREGQAGQFTIAIAEEDGHTAIENRLTKRFGDLGRRIHTGRSRNDQVIAALRLYSRERMLIIVRGVIDLILPLIELAKAHRKTSVAGYTHTRQAMPSTIGHLFAAHAESLIDTLPWLQLAYTELNRSPLGSASGFGVALPLDRERVSQLLGFDCVQQNTLAVQSARGKSEYLVLATVAAAIQDLSRLAADVIWYSSDELGYLRLDRDTTTGSSIMPQKRNPDIWELIRATSAQIRSRQTEVGAISAHLSSGYHRDLQLTKEPFVLSLETAIDLLAAAQSALRGISVNPVRCREAMLKATAATDEVYRRVAQGEPFRSAYRAVAADPSNATGEQQTSETWRLRTHQGAPGALDLSGYRKSVKRFSDWHKAQNLRCERVWSALLGRSLT